MRFNNYLIYLIIFFCACEARDRKKNIDYSHSQWVMVKSGSEKIYGVDCTSFNKEEIPFRINFANNELVEFYPAITKKSGSYEEILVGFKGYYLFVKDTLTIKPVMDTSILINYKVLRPSEDTLILVDRYGNQDYYYRKDFINKRTNSKMQISRVEIEISPSISNCYPYTFSIDSTMRVSFTAKGEIVVDEITSDEFTGFLAWFEKADLENLSVSENYEKVLDSRRVKITIWTGGNPIKIETDTTLLPYELKRVLIIIDDYVYNYFDDKKMILY